MPSHVVESAACRRLVGHLSGGGELSETLVELCNQHGVRAGEVRITGVLADVELSTFDAAGRGFSNLGVVKGPVTVVCAYGNVTELGGEVIVGVRGVVGWGDRGQFRVAGGHILQAEVISAEVVLDAFDDLLLVRRMDASLGLPVLYRAELREDAPVSRAPAPARPAQPAAEPPKPSGKDPAPLPSAGPLPTSRPTGWSDVVAMSKKLDEAEDEDWVSAADVDVRRGDVFLHPRFGRCTVVRLEADERAVTRDGDGKPRTLSLEHIRVRLVTGKGKKPREFELQVARKKGR